LLIGEFFSFGHAKKRSMALPESTEPIYEMTSRGLLKFA
jgi:hypothetical protein